MIVTVTASSLDTEVLRCEGGQLVLRINGPFTNYPAVVTVATIAGVETLEEFDAFQNRPGDTEINRKGPKVKSRKTILVGPTGVSQFA